MQIKFTAVIMLIFCMHVNAKSYAQINLKENNETLTKIFKHIGNQSGYNFLFSYELLQQAGKASVNLTNASLKEAMAACLAGKELAYTIVGKTIIIKKYQGQVVSETAVAIPPPVTVAGSVVDSLGNPIGNATIRIVGKNAGATTDANGRFHIVVEIGDELQISYVGYKTKTIKVTSGADLRVQLSPDVSKLDDIIMIGYGTESKRNVTGAIASVNIKDISADVSNNVSSAIQGRIAGVSVESNGGAPGAGLSLTIRGSSTLGNNTPLYVVDGVFLSSLDFVNPQDVESIEVLKDASAASIYGSRAANGVVIVTTKSGKRNTDVQVKVSGLYAVQSVPKRMSLLSGKEWTDFYKTNVGGIPEYNGVNTDWQDAIFRNAPTAKTNFNISGGSDHFTYNLSGGFMNQDGTIKTTNYSLANFRVKTAYEKGRLRIGETVIYNKTKNRNMTTGSSQAHSLVASALIMPPTVPVYDTANPLGGWGRRSSYMKNIGNPVTNLEAFHYLDNNSAFLAEAFAEVRIVDQLKYKFNVGLTENRGLSYDYADAFDDGNSAVTLPSLSQSTGYSSSWLIENTLSYDKTIGRHHFSLLAGFTAQKDTSNGFNASGNGIPVGLYVLNAATANKNIGGSASSSRRESFLGRLTYNYDSRYLFSAAIRRDGSSVFATGYQYGVFPSVSAGWNISNEAFFKNAAISNTISNLKLRGSWGILGNDLIPNYTSQNTLSSNASYMQGSSLWFGTIPNGNASPVDLKWEQTKTTDIGIDAGFFDNKLSLTADVFKRTTSGVLLGVPVPPSLGITGSPIVNAGVVENKGFEIALDYAGKSGNFNYRFGANATAMKNDMTAITIGSGSQEFGDITKAKVGYPLGGFWLIKTDGIFQSDQEASAYVKDNTPIQPNAKGGDIKFVDFNDDGKIDNNDRQYMGTPFPKLVTGLYGNANWKNWDLNLLIQGTFGNKIFNGWRIWMEKMEEVTNLSTSVLDAWTPENHSNFPRFILADPNLNAQSYTDRWLENGSYLRLKRVEIGYTVPKSLTDRIKIQAARFYISGENIFTITKYKGYNPDIGNGGNPLSRGIDDNNIYPLQRTTTVGMSITF